MRTLVLLKSRVLLNAGEEAFGLGPVRLRTKSTISVSMTRSTKYCSLISCEPARFSAGLNSFYGLLNRLRRKPCAIGSGLSYRL